MADRTGLSTAVERENAGIVSLVAGLVLALLLVITALPSFQTSLADAAPLMPGDVLVGQDTVNATGTVRQYRPDGLLLDTLDTTIAGLKVQFLHVPSEAPDGWERMRRNARSALSTWLSWIVMASVCRVTPAGKVSVALTDW